MLDDQFGDAVDLWDFYDEEVPVVIALCVTWCGACGGLSEWITGGDDGSTFATLWPGGPAAVASGAVRWITILAEDSSGLAATVDTAAAWSDLYRARAVPVLADTDGAVQADVGPTQWPTMIATGPELRVLAGPEVGYDEVLRQLAELYP